MLLQPLAIDLERLRVELGLRALERGQAAEGQQEMLPDVDGLAAHAQDESRVGDFFAQHLDGLFQLAFALEALEVVEAGGLGSERKRGKQNQREDAQETRRNHGDPPLDDNPVKSRG